MYFELAKQFYSRNKKLTGILSFVNSFIILLLITSLCLSSGLSQSINKLNNEYSIIGEIEYTGESYPNLTQDPDESYIKAANEISEFLNDDRIEYFEPYSHHFGSLDTDKNINTTKITEHAVLEVKISQYNEEKHIYYAHVTKDYYSSQPIINHLIIVDANGIVLENEHYLIHGIYYYAGAYDAVGLNDYDLYDYGVNTQYINVEDGTADISMFESIASSYNKILHSAEIVSSSHISNLLEFNQSYLTLKKGLFPNDNECLISSTLAMFLGKDVGDSISIHEFTKTNTKVEKMYNGLSEFQRDEDWVISGIFEGSEEYYNNIYIYDDEPVPTYNSWTIGEIKLKNNEYSSFISDFKLPVNYKVTYYDQGYGIIMDGLKNIQNIISVITFVTILVSLAFLVLFAYLLLKAQGNNYRTMIRQGNRKKELASYTSFTSFIISIPGIMIAAPVGIVLSIGLQKALLSYINNNSSIIFSNYAISVVKELEYTGPDYLFILSSLILYLMMNVLICIGFIIKSMNPNRNKRRKHLFKVRTQKFNNDYSYGIVSLNRGGFKSASTILLFIISALLFTTLPQSIVKSKEELTQFKEETTISGYFTNYTGNQYDNLVVFEDAYKSILDNDLVEDVSCSRFGNYRIIYIQDSEGNLSGPGLPPQPIGSYAIETYVEGLSLLDKIKATNNVYGSAEFMYMQDRVNIEWLDGYSNSDLSGNDLNTNICIIPKKIAEEKSCKLGDSLIVELLHGDADFNHIYKVKLLIVGIYDDDGENKTIYAQSSLFTSYEEIRKSGFVYHTETIAGMSVFDYCAIRAGVYESNTYQSVSFRVSGKNLDEVKSYFEELGFSQPNKLRAKRLFVLFNDINFINTERSLKQKIDYMRFLFPVIYVAAFGIATALGYEAIKSKQSEAKILHNLGADSKTISINILFPHIILALCAYAITVACVVYYYGFGISFMLLSGTLVLYIAGLVLSFGKIRVFNRKKVREEM